MLATMMMAGGMGSSSAGAGAGMGDLIAPLMMLLLEKILSEQLSSSEEKSERPEWPSASQASDDPNVSAWSNNGFSTSEPHGRPVGGVLTQGYHARHCGLDFGIPVGTPVKTTMDGQVVHAGWNNQGYGNLVIVENGAFRTYYAHLSSIPVQVGDQVSAGSVVGLSGNTGNSTGPHLHYEIRNNMQPINPTQVTLNDGS